MSEAYLARQKLPDNRLFMFYQVDRMVGNSEMKRLKQEIIAHPMSEFIKISLLYAHIHRTMPSAETSHKSKRQKHIDCMFEILDVLDVIQYGKTGVRNA